MFRREEILYDDNYETNEHEDGMLNARRLTILLSR